MSLKERIRERQERREQQLKDLRGLEMRLKQEEKDAKERHGQVKRALGRTTRMRLELEKEISRKIHEFAQTDYRMRKRNLAKLGETLDFVMGGDMVIPECRAITRG